MNILIDIDDYDREWIANGYHIPDEINRKIAEAIIDGTPLPEHHGRIIDESQISRIEFHTERELYGDKIRYVKVTDAPTIIEKE